MSNKNIEKKIGIFGGSFDPPHRGHVQIAKLSLKKLKLKYLIWAITKRNPLKEKPMLSLKSRILLSKKLVGKNKRIKIQNLDERLKTNKTIELVRFLKKNLKNSKLYFIMGSDNIINLHKWHGWKKFQKYCTIVVFPRKGYLKKMLISKAYRLIKKDKLIFLKSKIADISSSKIRKNYLIYR